MKASFFLILPFFLCVHICFGQHGRTKNWVLGDSVLIDFNTTPPSTGTSALESFEGFSVISDTNGTPLFYTNGIDVWNASHQQMLNGFGLNSALSATNAALIVPQPGNDRRYYIFTVGAYGGNQGGFGGLAYSVVDMDSDGGLGEVVVKNVVLHTKSTEKLCATLHENNRDFWIMSHDFGDNQFRAHLLTSDGIDSPPVISRIGAVHFEYPEGDWGSRTTGSMRFSPSGCKLALVLAGTQTDTIQLFKFDKSSGYLFDPMTLRAGVSQTNPYALCFSPDNSKLYVSGFDWIVQFNLAAGTQPFIQFSKTLIATNTLFESGSPKYEFEDLQITPAGQIYVSRMLCNYLSSISQPNNAGSACDFVDNVLSFSNGHSEYGLPNFVSNFLLPDTTPSLTCEKFCPELNIGADKTICEGDTVAIVVDLPQGELTWNDGSSSFVYPITQAGSYITTYDFNNCPVQVDTIIVDLIQNLTDELKDTVLCFDEPFVIALPNEENTTYTWSTGQTGNEFTTLQAGIFTVTSVANDCVFQQSFELTNDCGPILEMPNVFSPNGDGINDYLIPANMKNVDKLEISIVNRWGNIVFTSDETNFSWDGSCDQKRCSNGVYSYSVSITGSSNEKYILSGHVSLTD